MLDKIGFRFCKRSNLPCYNGSISFGVDGIVGIQNHEGPRDEQTSLMILREKHGETLKVLVVLIILSESIFCPIFCQVFYNFKILGNFLANYILPFW